MIRDRRLLVLLGVTVVLAIGAFAWIYAGDLTYYDEPPIRSDGTSYYVYLPAALIDHDLTLRRTASHVPDFQNDVEYISGVNWVRSTSGKLLPLDPHGVGVAFLLAPFFGVGHLLAVVSRARQNGFTWPYQAAAAAAGCVYGLLGLLLLASVLGRFFSRRTVLLTVAGITFGAGIFHYLTYDATYSHVYSFFLIALIVRLTLSVWDRPRVANVAALGASFGVLGMVRMTNLVLVVFCALVGVENFADLRRRPRVLARHLDLVALGAGAFVLTLLPQLAYWYRITGHVLINPYEVVVPPVHEDLLHPHLVGVLFSVRKGLFFWTPILLLAVAGLPALRRKAPPLFLPTVVYLPVVTWVVASWSRWWYDGSFGMRGLVDAMPVFALGLASIVETARQPAARRALLAGMAVTTVLALHGMVSYWLRSIPYDHTTFREYLQSFVHYHARTWHFSN
ncbi:MAG: hypothetical protein JO064_06755 [Actinobacteria bacterium]|nr:hypothetical protein [Actinomycetota bacterium]